MVRIDAGRPGRRDGAYARMFDDADIGALISRIHATSIRAGSELEHIIQREAATNNALILDLDKFLANGVDGVFTAGKQTIRQSQRINFPGAEPDYLVFVRNGGKRLCYVVELKDGDQFDTKKSSGEVASLTNFSTSVGSTLPYETAIRICSFNQGDKETIVAGFKRTVDESLVWTGSEFCELLGLDYDAIVAERRADAEANRRFFVQELCQIPSVRDILRELATGSGA